MALWHSRFHVFTLWHSRIHTAIFTFLRIHTVTFTFSRSGTVSFVLQQFDWSHIYIHMILINLPTLGQYAMRFVFASELSRIESPILKACFYIQGVDSTQTYAAGKIHMTNYESCVHMFCWWCEKGGNSTIISWLPKIILAVWPGVVKSGFARL